MKKIGIGQTNWMPWSSWHRKILNVMKWNVLFLFFFCMNLSANSFSQSVKVSLELDQVSVKEFLKTVQQQTGINFLYNANLLESTKNVSVSVKNEELNQVLKRVLTPNGLTFVYEEGTVIIKKNDEKKEPVLKYVVGTVRDERGESLPGVTVMLKGSSIGTSTDVKGEYKLYISDTTKSVLVFSFVGMETQEIKYQGQKTINVVMKDDLKEMEEVVVTGYQTLSKRSMAGSVSVVKAEDLVLNGMQSLEQALQGKIPGMMVMNRSGLTGTRQRVRVRGTSTLLGNADPVWVVDDVIQEDPLPFNSNDLTNLSPDNMDMIRDFIGGAISWLNPNDIETVTVLKDAASTAIYGVKAANGVIVITTKKGKEGRMFVSYNGNYSYTPRMNYNKLELMDSKQRVDVSREAFQNNILLEGNQSIGYWGLAKAFKNREITYEEFNREVKKLETTNTDWFKILFRDAFSHNHNISMSGGTKESSYRASFGYSDTKNTAKGNEQRSYTGNMSMSTRLWDKINVSTNLAGSVSKTKGFMGTDPYGYASSVNRIIPAYNADGSYYFYEDQSNRFLFNVENELKNTSNENTQSGLNASVGIRWRFNENFSFNSFLSYSYTNSSGESYYSEKTMYIAKIRNYNYREFGPGTPQFETSKLPNGGELNQTKNTSESWGWRNQLEWKQAIGRHTVMLMGGFEMRSSMSQGSALTTYGYLDDRGKIFVNLPPITQEKPLTINELLRRTPKLTEQESNFISYYITGSYMFDNRYSFNISLRGDGSNRFGQDKRHRFQPVWALGFRWNLGSEPWVSESSFLNDMSFRVSYGFQGNVAENVSPELIATVSSNPDSYDYMLRLKDLPAPDLKWEKVQNINMGFDWSLFKNKVTGTFEYYYKKTTDMIVQYDVPFENGVDFRKMNGGKMSNHGWDLSFSFTPVRTKDWMATVSLTTGKVYNKVESQLTPSGSWSEAASGNLTKEGYPVSSFWVFRYAGLNPENGGPMFDFTGAENSDAAKQDATLYMDWAGKMEPDFTAGISINIRYKSFSLNSGLYLSTGSQNFRANMISGAGTSIPSEYTNMSTEWLDRWRKPGDEKFTDMPSLPNKTASAKPIKVYEKSDAVSPYALYARSDARVVDTWYLRCNSLNLSYTFPGRLLPSKLQNLSVNCSLSNPFQIRSKDFKGRDPEVALGKQPLQHNVTLGVSASF